MSDVRRVDAVVRVLGVGALALVPLLGAADPQPTALATFPAGVDVINLNVSVLNRRDRFVTDLALNDFHVYEDGIRQQPMVFAQEDLPISMVLLIDMSASMKPHLNLVRKAAGRLIAQLRPEDRAQVIEFSDRPTVLQEFTSDQAALLDAVGRVRPGGTTALHNVLYITLKDVATLSKTEGMRRRAIVLLSDGEDTASMINDDQVLEAARACEINVYSILLGTGAQNAPGPPVQARYLLSALARESGGFAFFPRSPAELGRLYERVAQELRSQYSIGYVSSRPDYDGSWRQILVLTPEHGQLNIRHRLGYYAVPDAPLPRAKTSDARLGGSTSGRP